MSLNPEAAEFCPAFHPHRRQATQIPFPANHHNPLTLSSPFCPSLNPTPPTSFCCTGTLCYSTGSFYPCNGYSSVPQNYGLLPAPTEPSPSFLVTYQSQHGQAVLGAKMALEVVTKPVSPPRDDKRRRRRNYCFSGRRRGSGGYNGREKCCRGRENRSEQTERWRPKSESCDQTQKSSRRNARCSGSSIPKQPHPVVPLDPNGQNTTVMIRNIPNRYTRQMLIEFLDNYCMEENQKAKLGQETALSAFDFLYLPVDFDKGANKGYAFVNFTNATAAWKFHNAATNQPWTGIQSHKIRQIACAKLQGKEALLMHFMNSIFECETDEFLPICFSPARDGSRVMVEQRIVGRRAGN